MRIVRVFGVVAAGVLTAAFTESRPSAGGRTWALCCQLHR